MKQSGFTLIEVLIALAIFGILIVLVLNLQTSVIGFTDAQNNAALRLQGLNEVGGYLGDRVKTAQAVRDGITVDGEVCQMSAAAPCLAVVLPTLNPDCGTDVPVNWTLHAFRYVARSAIPAAEKTPAPGLDTASAGAYGLKETQVPLTDPAVPTTCTAVAPPSNTASYMGTARSGYVTDNLTLVAGQNAFSYATTGGKNLVTLRLRTVSSSRNGLVYTPVSGSYELQVYARNVK
ncbi:PulJ/GspJ family protein [Deinococcus aquaedulcis]|uniref:PulJ/GspJ family protein n=1 Tax=Deinococcus aquaedulcis TaxID=2840455 RepID=UPI001C82D2E4|nr:prepilin-type N-terminal cleavage/methylation domain-containing protein [Deinococcus aquaedulcis]